MLLSHMGGLPNDGESDDVVQMVIDRVEEVVITIIEMIRERPAVAAAIIAATIAAIIGASLARPKKRVRPPVERGDVMSLVAALLGSAARAQLAGITSDSVGNAKSAAGKAAGKARKSKLNPFGGLKDLGNAGDLASMAVQLLENPLVRSYLRSMVSSRLRKRFS